MNVKRLRQAFVLLVMCFIGSMNSFVYADWTNADSYGHAQGFKAEHTPTLSEPWIEWTYPTRDTNGDDDALMFARFWVGSSQASYTTWKSNPSYYFQHAPNDCQGTQVGYSRKEYGEVTRYNTDLGAYEIVSKVDMSGYQYVHVRFYFSDKWSREELQYFFVRFSGWWDYNDDWKTGYWMGEAKCTVSGDSEDNGANFSAHKGLLSFLNSNTIQTIPTESASFERSAPGKISVKGSGVQAYSGWNSNYAFASNGSYDNTVALGYGSDYGKVSVSNGALSHTFSVNNNDIDPVTIYYHKFLTRSVSPNGGITSYKPNVTVNQLIDGTLASYTIPGLRHAIGLSFADDKFAGKIAVKWSHGNETSTVPGKWYVFRKSPGQTSYTKLTADPLPMSSTSFDDTNCEVGVDYSYKVTFVPDTWGSISEPINSGLTTEASHTIAKTFSMSIDRTDGTGEEGNLIEWSAEKGKQKEIEISLEKFNEQSGLWSEIAKNTNGSYVDKDVETFVSYTYRLRVVLWGQEFTSSSVTLKYMKQSQVRTVATSRGDYSNMVKVSWTAKQYGTADTRYTVERRILTDEKSIFAPIYETQSTNSNFYFEDVSALPGQYYEYRVSSAQQDPNTGDWSEGSSLTSDGFSTARGILTGRVSFGSGTAVDNVVIRLKKNSDDDDSAPIFYSLYSSNQTGIISWTPSKNTVKNYLHNGPLTIQMWLSPDEGSSDVCEVISVSDQVNLSLVKSAEGFDVVLTDADGSEICDRLATINAGVYTHIALVYDNGKFRLYTTDGKTYNDANELIVNQSADVEASFAWTDASGNARTLTIGGSGNADRFFRGNVDDVRVWTKALTLADNKANFNRMLTGTEAKLLCYWPLDEGVDGLKFAYDVSKTNGVPNGNHATVSSGISTSSHVPQPEQLSLYAITDDQGNYTLRGVPFTGDGTSYTVQPSKGVHEFSPQYLNRYVSNTSLTHNGVDFEDISSFPVKGKVCYQGTTIPVEGVYLFVDENMASRDGAPIMTDANGEFTIDVPIGDHYIKVEKVGHTFLNDGRYPKDTYGTGERKTFVKEMTGLTFTDNTLVPVVGRVTGGDIEFAKPLGLAQSKANIGKAIIKLEGPNKDKYYINAVETVDGLVTTYDKSNKERRFDAATSDVKSSAYVEGGANVITIETDPATGEWAAMLPPVSYTAASIIIPSQPDINMTNRLFILDATNAQVLVSDSVQVDGSNEYIKFEYCASAKVNYKGKSQFEVKEHANGAFGDKEIVIRDLSGNADTLQLYTIEPDGSVNYTFGYPITTMYKRYTYNMYGFERYANLDDPNDPKYDDVPLKDVDVTVANGFAATTAFKFADGSVYEIPESTLKLDSLGHAVYTFCAGVPNLTENGDESYTKSLSISYNIDGTELSWSGNGFKSITLGSLPSGSNFRTNGPDKVSMILRDPPGTGSSATWSEGTSVTTTKSFSASAGLDAGVDTETQFGVKLGFYKGSPVCGVIYESETDFTLGVGMNTSYSHEYGNVTSYTVTNSRDISTSDGPDFVGAIGDLFIGNSTNIVLSPSRTLKIVKNTETGEYEFKVINSSVAGETFETQFVYTANMIENNVIPGFEEERDALIQSVPDVMAVEPSKEGKVLYVSSLSRDDENWGKSNCDVNTWGDKAVKFKNFNFDENRRLVGPSYTVIAPEDYDSKDLNKVFEDQVHYLNQQIALWQANLRMNEEAKVLAFKNRDKYIVDNYSFDGGSNITFTNDSSYSATKSHTNNFSVELSSSQVVGTEIGGTGVEFTISETVTNEESWTTETDTTKTVTMSYTLAEDGDDDYISVDVLRDPINPQFGYIFHTRGGATSAPYEDVVETKYYEPGTVISESTLQIEKPQLVVLDPIVTGVPSGRDAIFRISLQNISETGEDCYFGLWVNPDSNPDGAQVFLDGINITPGVEILCPAGVAMQKTLYLRQTNPDILEYKNISLSLYSTSQPDDTGNYPGIYSDAEVSVYFQPSCTPIDMVASTALVNTETTEPVMFSMSGYDYNQASFNRIRFQYKGANDAQFKNWKEFVKDEELAKADPNLGVFTALAGTDKLNIAVDMTSNDNFVDQTYIFRAQTVGVRGGEEVVNYSDEITIVRDMARPELIANPTPTSGVVRYGDNITLTFNEDIRGSILSKLTNFVVSGVKNEIEVDHNVALSLTGKGVARTESTINLNGKSFSANFWLYYSNDGRLMTHGSSDNRLKVAIADGKLAVDIAGQSISSDLELPKDKWLYVVLSCEAQNDQTLVNAGYAEGADVVTLIANKSMPKYEGNGPFTIGGENLEARVQELTLWNEARSVDEAVADMHKTKSQYTSGLIGYWQMNEGHGNVASDRSRNRNMTIETENAWYLNAGENYALALNDAPAVVEGNFATRQDESYLVEMWFKNSKAGKAASIFSLGRNANLDVRVSETGKVQLGVAGQYANAYSNESVADGQWHHIALNVLKSTGGSTTLYLDGNAVYQTSASKMPLLGNAIVLGGLGSMSADYKMSYTQPLIGAIDEVRVWKGRRTADVINASMYARVQPKEEGLEAYYPFEICKLDEYGQVVTEPSPADQTGSGFTAKDNADKAVASTAFTKAAPSLATAPAEENLEFSFVASERQITIKLEEPVRNIENCNVSLVAKNIQDIHGNSALPIKWTVYVNQNQLKWSESEVALTTKVNEELKFDIDIINNGATGENWTISGMPSWLNGEMSGSLSPLETKNMTFTVAPSLAIGSYDVTLYLRGSQNINVPLYLNLTVTGDAPNWVAAVDEFTMNVVGQLKVDGVLSNDENDLVAAFRGTKCVGVAKPAYNARYDSYFVLMTVYGDATNSGSELVYKVYDASTGTIYPSASVSKTAAQKFVPDTWAGSFTDAVIFSPKNEIEQDISSNRTGWKWMSLYVVPADSKLDYIFRDVNGEVSLVKNDKQSASYTATKTSDNSNWYGDFENMGNATFYKVKIDELYDETVIGAPAVAQDIAIELNNGWTWVGYPQSKTMSLENAFADANPTEGDIVKSQSAFAIYSSGEWNGSLKAMTPGEGYMYYSSSTVKTFHFPDAVGNKAALAPVAYTSVGKHFIDHLDTESNMTVVAHVVENGMEVSNAVVNIYNGEELCSTVKAVGGTSFITIGAQNGDRLTVVVTTENGDIVMNETIEYSADQMLGSIIDPYLINLGDTQLGSVSDSEIEEIVVYNTSGLMIMDVKNPSAALTDNDFEKCVKGVYLQKIIYTDGRTKVVKMIR